MLTPIGKLEFEDGTLKASSPNLPTLSWDRPAALAEARLESDPPPASLEIADGADALAAAFKVLPFVRAPLPSPVFGPSVTPAARAAFALLAGTSMHEPADSFRVLRGEVDDFIVFARRYKDVWMAGALAVDATTLTFRFEDLWHKLPEASRYAEYMVEVVRDDPADTSGCVRETLPGVAPDARIMLDLRAGGGFTLSFWPVAAS
jgi:hypothetical protein